MSTQWTAIVPERCDLCSRVARWRHPAGGLRCDRCPKPFAPCDRCGATATRWSGGDTWTTSPMRNIGIAWRCDACDPYNKWFRYDGEQIRQRPDGRWEVLNG